MELELQREFPLETLSHFPVVIALDIDIGEYIFSHTGHVFEIITNAHDKTT
jgi:hydrogenase maturation factor